MTFEDIGPAPRVFDIEAETLANDNYRTVAWSGVHLQVTFMSIPVGGDIGLEVHPDNDQFLRFEAGRGLTEIGDSKDDLSLRQEVSDDWVVCVPAGKWHNVTNIGDEPLKLYSIYAPVHHAAGKVHPTQADSEADEEAGTDEPPEWSVQP